MKSATERRNETERYFNICVTNAMVSVEKEIDKAVKDNRTSVNVKLSGGYKARRDIAEIILTAYADKGYKVEYQGCHDYLCIEWGE